MYWDSLFLSKSPAVKLNGRNHKTKYFLFEIHFHDFMSISMRIKSFDLEASYKGNFTDTICVVVVVLVEAYSMPHNVGTGAKILLTI